MTDHGEWFGHTGGECPVPPETWVYVQRKGWWDAFGRADGFNWEAPCRYQVLNQWIPNRSKVAEARRKGYREGLLIALTAFAVMAAIGGLIFLVAAA